MYVVELNIDIQLRKCNSIVYLGATVNVKVSEKDNDYVNVGIELLLGFADFVDCF